LSADMCSLKQGVDRAALACHLRISKGGELKSWRFTRAVVRIAANIAYEDAQAMIDSSSLLVPLPLASDLTRRGRDGPRPSLNHAGGMVDPDEAGHWARGGPVTEARSPSDTPSPDPSRRAGGEKEAGRGDLLAALLPLWACWRALYKAREKRGPLDLDLPERRVVLDEKGRILSVAPRERLDAHKLIEDYMIAANVAAAKALEAKKAPVMYRVHEPPSREKLVALKDYLKTFGVEFALGQVVRPATFNHILDKVGDVDFRPQIMEQVLRTQTQAYYAPENHGHFGLALGSYGHFTSPIRSMIRLNVAGRTTWPSASSTSNVFR